MAGKSLKQKRPLSSSLDEIQEKLAPLIDDPAGTAIFLDLDGTLAPIMPRPEEVAIPPEISKLVRKLGYHYLAVTVVSGRPATEAKRIVGNADLAYIGNHGFETLLPGHAVVVCDEAQPYVTKIRELLEYARGLPDLVDSGIWLEDKTATMSFHYRRSPDQDAALALIRKVFLPKIEKLGLAVSEGRKVLEVRPPVDVNKGVAVGRLMDRLEVKKALYAGDDTTDIDALKELRKRRRRKQIVVGVGVISDEMPPTLPKFCDVLVERISGMELVLQLLAGEEL
jgi:trehalose 6-phosphate phosphatase